MTRHRKLFERKRRLIVAVILAAAFRAESLTARELWQAFYGVVRALIPFRHCNRWLYFRRLRHCFRCDLFYRPLRTCGSSLESGFENLGCGCNMEHKAAQPQATCWMNEHTDLKSGWPKRWKKTHDRPKHRPKQTRQRRTRPN